METYIQGRCRLMYIQYINLVDKSFRVNNVFLDEQEQFRVFVVFKRGVIANVYIRTGEDFISLQLVSYPFVLFCMTLKYA
jgi:hypothetical protein